MASVVAFFTGIKEVLVLINNIVGGAKAVAQFVQDNKDEKWFQDSAVAYEKLREAKTKDERTEAFRKIRDSWARL